MTTPSRQFLCPACGASFPPQARFCGQCGANLEAGASPHRAPATGRGTGQKANRDEPAPAPAPGAAAKSRPGRSIGETEVEFDLSGHLEREPWLGRVIDSRYLVVERIGQGGMGVVYKVEHQRLGKIAAMKVLQTELAGYLDVVERFRREAEAVSRLTHPNTVQVFDFGTARGALYLIMEYVRGTDLGTILESSGAMPFARVAPIMGQVCAALVEAHSLGVIHRDLKPDNLLVTQTHGGRDFVKVLDFGLAKLGKREEPSELTERGAIIGTPYYMSPEQIRGEAVDHRSDIYSLGALMYRLLTGEPAYTATTPVGVLTRHLTAPLEPPSTRRPDLGIDPRVDAIVIRAMAKQPGDRYPSVAAMLDDLEAAYGGLRISQGAGPGAISLPPAFAGARASAALADEEIDDNQVSEVRLRRADIDAYETALRRRRWLRVAGAPLFVAAAGAAALWFFLLRPDAPRSREREPNNDPSRATLIAAAMPVQGTLGRRVSSSQGDIDYYRLATPPAGDEIITVHAAGLPNIDIELVLLDATGTVIAHRNEGGIGHGEWIRNWRTGSRALYVAVAHVALAVGHLPVENVSDEYTLSVRYNRAEAGVEVEPNDSQSDAVVLRPGAPIAGYLSQREDADFFLFLGEGGAYHLRIDGAADVPVAWQAGSRPLSRARSASVSLASGDLVRLVRTDNTLPPGRALPGADEPYVLEVTRLAPSPQPRR